MSLQHNCNALSSFQTFCNQNSHSMQANSHKIQNEMYNGVISNLANARVSSPATLQMQAFRASVKTCQCKGFHDFILPCFMFSQTYLTLTKAIKHIYMHYLLLYNQACSFNRKRLEQIFTLSTKRLFIFYCHGAHNRTLFYQM